MNRWLVRVLVVLATIYLLMIGYDQFSSWLRVQVSNEPPQPKFCYGDLAIKIPCKG